MTTGAEQTELTKARAKIAAVEKVMAEISHAGIYDALHAAIYSDQWEQPGQDELKSRVTPPTDIADAIEEWSILEGKTLLHIEAPNGVAICSLPKSKRKEAELIESAPRLKRDYEALKAFFDANPSHFVAQIEDLKWKLEHISEAAHDFETDSKAQNARADKAEAAVADLRAQLAAKEAELARRDQHDAKYSMYILVEHNRYEALEKAEAERDELKKALVMYAADTDDQLKQARDGRATAQAEVDELRKDRERLDWLESASSPQPGNIYPLAALVFKKGYNRDSYDWVNAVGTVRESIDAAKALAPATQEEKQP